MIVTNCKISLCTRCNTCIFNGLKDEIKEDIEKDLVSIANEFAEMSQDHDVRSMFNDYIEFSDDRKKQVRNFITFIKNH